MRVLTTFEFISAFPENRSVIFVGNAPSLTDEGLGEWVDSHDVVVRFNECPVSDFESDVGHRTDILVSNPYPEGRSRVTSLTSSDGVILIISPQTRRGDIDEFRSWVGDSQVLFTYAPDLVQVGEVDHKAALTTGTYGIHLLTRLLKPSRVSVTGFTMFLKDTSCHYYSSQSPKGMHAHDMNIEADIFIKVCNSLRNPVEVTADVSWVANMIGMTLRPDMQVRPLKDPRWTVS